MVLRAAVVVVGLDKNRKQVKFECVCSCRAVGVTREHVSLRNINSIEKLRKAGW